MRKILLSIGILIPLLVFGILILKNQSTTPEKSGAQNFTSSQPSSESGSNSLTINNFTIAWQEISDLNNLKLIPNFNEQLLSKEVIQNNNCQFLVNGPFYSQNHTPLGLIIANGNQISPFQENSLMDGILSVNDFLTPRITRTVPDDHLQLAVQSGPIAKENGQFINLKIANDKESRRVLAGVTGENKLFFLTIYNKNSEYLGPFLSGVPSLISQFEKNTNITFADVINLDGGSASAFVTGTLKLYEFNSVGAFFCQS